MGSLNGFYAIQAYVFVVFEEHWAIGMFIGDPHEHHEQYPCSGREGVTEENVGQPRLTEFQPKQEPEGKTILRRCNMLLAIIELERKLRRDSQEDNQRAHHGPHSRYLNAETVPFRLSECECSRSR